MPKREVDKRKTRKALRKLRGAAERAAEEGGPGLTHWEKEFVQGVSGRLEKYGSAFRDPGKGRLEEALSKRQAQVARVIDKKTRRTKTGEPGAETKTPLKRSALKRKTPLRSRPGRRVRDVNEDPTPDAPASGGPSTPKPAERRSAFRVIPGGKDG